MNDQEIWCAFFSTVVGWSQHPGYYRENATKPTLEDCANIADEMMLVKRTRFPEGTGT